MRKSCLSVVILTLSLNLFACAEASKLIQWSGNGHWYAYVESPQINWQEAKEISEALGGTLVTITSQAENDFITDHFGDQFECAWLGGQKIPGSAPAENWYWITGETWNYTNWHAWEPTGFFLNDTNRPENYLNMWGTFENRGSGTWNDGELQNWALDGYIVEFDSLNHISQIQSQEMLQVAYYQGHTYCLLQESDWFIAATTATTMGGYLTTISNIDENNWIFNTFAPKAEYFGGNSLWIGLNDNNQDNLWEWMNGYPFIYANWAPGQPTHIDEYSEFYNAILLNNFPLEDLSLYPSMWHDVTAIPSDWDHVLGIVELDSLVIFAEEILVCSLTTSSSQGGNVTAPGEGEFNYSSNAVVSIKATPDAYWRFNGWTGTAVEAGEVSDLHDPNTQVFMSDNYTLTANFLPLDVNYPGLGYSLGTITFQSQAEFNASITTNNGRLDRATYVTGQQPDPSGMMEMKSSSSTAAIAKAGFEQTSQEKIQVEFSYLFSEDMPGMELVVYLSNVPELLSVDALQHETHYQEIGRITVPEPGRPGSVGSARFATFSCTVLSTLDLTRGSYLELQLQKRQTPQVQSLRDFEPYSETSGSVLVDGLSFLIRCAGKCLDFNGSTVEDSDDFAMLMVHQGTQADLNQDKQGSTWCMDTLYSQDGYIDKYDIHGLDHALSDSNDKDSYCNACNPTLQTMSVSTTFEPATETVLSLSDLLILGKQGRNAGTDTDKLRDCIIGFDTDLTSLGNLNPLHDRANIRLITDASSQLYILNSYVGLETLDILGRGTPLLPNGFYGVAPSLSESIAKIHLGIQRIEKDLYGYPVWDAVVRADALYVTPVVVEETDGSTYLAAAKLIHQGDDYQVAQVYDARTHLLNTSNNPALIGLREIDVDTDGNVYLLNAHYLNESDFLFRFGTDGTVTQVALNHPDNPNRLPDPLGLTVNSQNHLIYVASGQGFTGGAQIGVFNQNDLSRNKTLTVPPITHVTDTAVTANGTLCVIGYRLDDFFTVDWTQPVPRAQNPAFYVPCLGYVYPKRHSTPNPSIKRNTRRSGITDVNCVYAIR